MAREIEEIVRADPAVAEPGPALTMYLGPEEVLLNLEVAFEPGLTAGEIRAAVDRIEERLRERYPEITRVFIEVGSLRAADAGPGARDRRDRPTEQDRRAARRLERSLRLRARGTRRWDAVPATVQGVAWYELRAALLDVS